ncbi:hypothetical protein G9A89_001012 [Geosiphon pyriformis]|nr:hypothetical protein G9A89_001012 [Geosiphon pyriformis]
MFPIEEFDYNKQTVILPGSKQPGQTGIYRNALSPDKLIKKWHPEISTMYENFQYALKKRPDNRCLGHRPFNHQTKTFEDYSWQTYAQVHERFTRFGSGLLHISEHVIGNRGSTKFHVAVWSRNRPEHHITDQALAAYNLVSVPLYDTVGTEDLVYCLNHAEIPIIVCSADHLVNLLEVKDQIPGLKVIISMDDLVQISTYASNPVSSYSISDSHKAWASSKGVSLFNFVEIENIGKEYPREHIPPRPQDLFLIMYTSGTTGTSKGVMMTHENINSALSGIAANLPYSDLQIIISYLPLAHIFGRQVEAIVIQACGAIGYYHGDPLSLLEDAQLLKPTLFASVPRFWNALYSAIAPITFDAKGFKGALARRGIAVKLSNLEQYGTITHPLWDRLMFNKIKGLLGGNVKLIITAAAPIGRDIIQFLRIAFGAVVLEAYGQTETHGGSCIQVYGDMLPGNVGIPYVSSEIKLVDIPSMGYTSEDKPYPRGEVCVRGHTLMTGYFKDEEKTRETIDQEGWLHSGDVGHIDERGCLVIFDRVKNIFKLSQGEYIAPEKIEQVYLRLPIIAQLYVHGDSLQSELVGILVPNPDNFVPWANKEIIGEYNFQTLVKDKRVQKALLEKMNQIGRQSGLRGYELVKKIFIEIEPFSIENGLLTPT